MVRGPWGHSPDSQGRGGSRDGPGSILDVNLYSFGIQSSRGMIKVNNRTEIQSLLHQNKYGMGITVPGNISNVPFQRPFYFIPYIL